MVALISCGEGLADRLDWQDVAGQDARFTEAWRRDAWEGVHAHVALLLYGDRVKWIGQARGGHAITTFDRVVTVDQIEEIDEVRSSELAAVLPKRHRGLLDRRGVLPPAGARALVDALVDLRPSVADLIGRLQQPNGLRLPRGRRGEILSQERDGLGLLLDIGGVGRNVLRAWTPPPAGVPFLSGMPETPALEDHLIAHDIDRFSDWLSVPTDDVAWRGYEGGGRRMFVMNANRTPVEQTLGVDVVYWNEQEKAFVLVQYKKMTRVQNGKNRSGATRYKDVFRPDRNLADELKRMTAIDALCETQSGDFRLLPTPCWLKLCRFGTQIRDPAALIGGMYLARSHFEELLSKSAGPRGGKLLTYDNVPRHITNTMFTDLVKDGWIGSRGAATDQIEELIRQSLETRHAVVVGIETRDR